MSIVICNLLTILVFVYVYMLHLLLCLVVLPDDASELLRKYMLENCPFKMNLSPFHLKSIRTSQYKTFQRPSTQAGLAHPESSVINHLTYISNQSKRFILLNILMYIILNLRGFSTSLWYYAGGGRHPIVLHGIGSWSAQSEGCHHLLGTSGAAI